MSEAAENWDFRSGKLPASLPGLLVIDESTSSC